MFDNFNNQNGLALPIVLILLFVMTLVGVTALNNATLQDDMTANSRLRQSAFNAAEATLRDAENFLVDGGIANPREVFFGAARPSDTVVNPGDTCEGILADGTTGGLCTPAQFTSPAYAGTVDGERWEDPNLDVFNTAGSYFTYSNYANTDFADESVLEEPRYIIEFLGNVASKEKNFLPRPEFTGIYQTNCPSDPATGKPLAPNDEWPFCAADPKAYRITVRAAAGPPSREAVVLLQSTVRIP
ncbi:PilX N-terminal domain-containing pilus assembly protein [Arenicella sp.]|nr:PilX N-terminal domain-containing pilus assembly protein [Arenicella sp.]